MNKEAVSKLMAWCGFPHPHDGLHKILKGLTERDLVHVFITNPKEPAGRIAWAEYGRRQGFVDFELSVTSTEGKVAVLFDGEALPIHSSPALGLKGGDAPN